MLHATSTSMSMSMSHVQELLTSSAPDTTVRAIEYDLTLRIKPHKLNELLETALQGLWHTAQLHRLARGAEPDLHISRLYVLSVMFISQYVFPPARLLTPQFRNGAITGVLSMLVLAVLYTRWIG